MQEPQDEMIDLDQLFNRFSSIVDTIFGKTSRLVKILKKVVDKKELQGKEEEFLENAGIQLDRVRQSTIDAELIRLQIQMANIFVGIDKKWKDADGIFRQLTDATKFVMYIEGMNSLLREAGQSELGGRNIEMLIDLSRKLDNNEHKALADLFESILKKQLIAYNKVRKDINIVLTPPGFFGKKVNSEFMLEHESLKIPVTLMPGYIGKLVVYGGFDTEGEDVTHVNGFDGVKKIMSNVLSQTIEATSETSGYGSKEHGRRGGESAVERRAIDSNQVKVEGFPIEIISKMETRFNQLKSAVDDGYIDSFIWVL